MISPKDASLNDPIAAYIAKGKPWQQRALTDLRGAVLRAVPSAVETFQYGKPHYAVNGEFVAALHLATSKVSLLLLNADSLAPEKGFLRSLGNGERKVIDLVETDEIDIDRVVASLQAARRAHEDGVRRKS